MSNLPNLSILIITYKRTQIALKTIRGLQKFLDYPKELLHWHIADDGSTQEHRNILVEAIGSCTISNTQRQGVGASMNAGMIACLEKSDFILWLEDDWELIHPLDLEPHISLTYTNENVGMVRFGYISPGIKGELIGHKEHLWWKLAKGPTYTMTGHASLRSRQFCNAYGLYSTQYPPGVTELDMCAKFNGMKGPTVAVPVEYAPWSYFAHIGAESLKDTLPGNIII